MPLLEITDLHRSFYGVAALRGASLAVERGTITGLIGPNGAGKTTLFDIASGLVPPERGRVVFDGVDITGWRPDRITARGLLRTFQLARGCPRLTVLENLLLYGTNQPGEGFASALLRTRASLTREGMLRARALAIAERLRLTPVLDQPAAAISGGQKKLLELGRALMGEPTLILLDEPAAGVNPLLQAELSARLEELRADGMTFLVIEHDMDVIARLCDPIVVMADGRRLAEGGFAEVAEDPRVQEAYMGRRAWAS